MEDEKHHFSIPSNLLKKTNITCKQIPSYQKGKLKILSVFWIYSLNHLSDLTKIYDHNFLSSNESLYPSFFQLNNHSL